MEVSIVVPCWKTHAGLESYLDELRAAFRSAGATIQFILVMDGPEGATPEVEGLRSCEDVRLVALPRNFGQHAATLAGIHQSDYSTILTVDDDGEHDPSDAVRMVEALVAGRHQVIYGVRQDRQQAKWRRATSNGTKRYLARVSGLPAGKISSFRAIERTQAFEATNMHDPFFNLDAFLFGSTGLISSVDVVGRQARGGHSRYRLGSLVRYGWTLVTATTYAPLRAVTFAAGIAGVTALVLALVFLVSYFTGNDRVAGFTALATMIAVFAAMQLLALGVIAEYLARVHGRTMGLPTYVIIAEGSRVTENPE